MCYRTHPDKHENFTLIYKKCLHKRHFVLLYAGQRHRGIVLIYKHYHVIQMHIQHVPDIAKQNKRNHRIPKLKLHLIRYRRGLWIIHPQTSRCVTYHQKQDAFSFWILEIKHFRFKKNKQIKSKITYVFGAFVKTYLV